MSASRLFRQHTLSLLAFIDFDNPASAPEGDVLTLDLDDGRILHLVLLSDDAWMLLIEVPAATVDPESWLRLNQPDGEAEQAVVGLTDDGRPMLWLRLPLTGCSEASARAALQHLLCRSAALCEATAGQAHDARTAGALV
ncbi:CesT family type III secretion system chaperone [Paludibacterium yongneupense]|uniref:CesT family type III secretion system chaperone n=1 Tax=Paludibacterium yongneupense TaxID=400061 RepID=UPI000412242A|nr:CesT family type III secretion system chaperone [Paludibacterium yongneupense]